MDKVLIALGAVVVALVLIASIAVLTGTLVWLIWPHVAVAVFGLPPLTWWQAVLLSWLCSLLFKSPKVSSKKEGLFD